MSYLYCPMCGLSVPRAPSSEHAQLEECPRCLAHSGGAVSVKLAPRRADAHDRRARRSGSGLLAHLQPTAAKR
jgi:hypothetical protein